MAAQPVFDKQDQLDKITSGLLEREQLIAVYDAIGAGTGFIGITDRRVIVQDNSFVGKKVAVTSIPYSRITSLSVLSNKSMMGQFSRRHRSRCIRPGRRAKLSSEEMKAHNVHQVILWHITK